MPFDHMHGLNGYAFDVFACVHCGKLVKVIYPYWPFVAPYKATEQCECEGDKYVEVTYLPLTWHEEN